MGLDYSKDVIQDAYIWGVELIALLMETKDQPSLLQYVKISEEFIYY
jgi:hypothetical protein